MLKKKRTHKRKKQKLSLFALALVVAGSGFLYGVVDISWHDLSLGESQAASANISLSADVAPNPDNTLAADLQAKQLQLDVREANLSAREKNANSFLSTNFFSLLSLFLSSVLFVLIGLNFYLDVGRRGTVPRQKELPRKEVPTSLSVDLRTKR